MNQQELHRLARIGAQARLQELHREAEAIRAAFPNLRSGRSAQAQNPYTAGVRAAVSGVRGAVEGAVSRRRPKMSREARERIAEAQRKRWAEWKVRNGRTGSEEAAKQGESSAETPKASGGARKKK